MSKIKINELQLVDFMGDTFSENEEYVNEIMQIPQKRLEMIFSMNEEYRLQVTQAILEEYPNISKAGFRKELFLRYYGNDFTTTQKEKILKHLEDLTC